MKDGDGFSSAVRSEEALAEYVGAAVDSVVTVATER